MEAELDGARTVTESGAESRGARGGVSSAIKAFRSFLVNGRGSLTGEELRALQVDSPTAGGYLVAPQEFTAELIKAIDDQTFIRQLATVLPVTAAESLGAASLDADPADATWTSELGTGSEDSTMAFGKRELKPYPLGKRIKVSRRLLRLASAAEGIVRDRMAYKFGITLEKAAMTGSGAGQPLGVFTASNDGIPTSRDVATGNAATYPTLDGLIEAKYALKGGYWQRAGGNAVGEARGEDRGGLHVDRHAAHRAQLLLELGVVLPDPAVGGVHRAGPVIELVVADGGGNHALHRERRQRRYLRRQVVVAGALAADRRDRQDQVAQLVLALEPAALAEEQRRLRHDRRQQVHHRRRVGATHAEVDQGDAVGGRAGERAVGADHRRAGHLREMREVAAEVGQQDVLAELVQGNAGVARQPVVDDLVLVLHDASVSPRFSHAPVTWVMWRAWRRRARVPGIARRAKGNACMSKPLTAAVLAALLAGCASAPQKPAAPAKSYDYTANPYPSTYQRVASPPGIPTRRSPCGCTCRPTR